jgi:hypothetical protein
VANYNSKRLAGHVSVFSDQMIHGQPPVSRAAPRRVLAAAAKGAWVTDLFFWLFFVTDVFACCYWPISRLGALLVQISNLPLKTARIAVLLLSALLTPIVIRGIILLLKRNE